MAESTAKTILGVLLVSPALIRSTEDLCEDLFIGRDKQIFLAIDRLWNDTEPESIPLPLLVDKLDGKVPATYVSSLLDGVIGVKPEGFRELVSELARIKLAKAIVKTVTDIGAESVKTGQIDIATLKPLILRYDAVGEKEKVMSSSIREWVYQSSGEFSVSKVYADLGAKSVQQKGLVRAVIHALLKDDIITRVGREEGHYRKVEKELDEVDLMGVAPTPLDLYLPLGLDKLVKIYPKSIVVFAGASNKGKTALCHDFIKGNMAKHDCHLFFSEGGVESLRDRLEKHADKMIGEWRFKAYPRTRNFEDVVQPDGINVIDYLLVPDEFWKVGQYLDDIYRKLSKGVAYVNLQKGTSSEVGRGGDFGLERPSLYVTLSPDPNADESQDGVQHCIAKVAKAKAWKYRTNPDGRVAYFQIEEGWKIHHDNVWQYPAKKEPKRETEFHPRRTT